MTALRMGFHETTGRRIVEITDDRGRLIGAIYPTEDGSNSIHIVSRHFEDDPFKESLGGIPVPGYTVKFKSP